eukprot:9504000-Pyramimonas_sp.AAC.2
MTFTDAGRLRLCSDIISVRRTVGLSIRMSKSRETDRFTLVQRSALKAHDAVTAKASPLEDLRVLYMNVYLSRTALSEQSRHALATNAFPFFQNDTFSLGMDAFLDKITDVLLDLLKATSFAPYGRALMPYANWVENHALYLKVGHNLCALEDALVFAATLADCSWYDLTSPAKMEALIAGAPHFGTFRSKEIWIDAAEIILQSPDRYHLSPADTSRVSEELLLVGEPGPGPRRVIRFVAGDPVSKDPFSIAEVQKYKDVTESILKHFQMRFKIDGAIQAWFQVCEASKGVTDLFCGTGVPYEPFKGYAPPSQKDVLDAELHDSSTVRKRMATLANRIFSKYPALESKLRGKLPQ